MTILHVFSPWYVSNARFS